MFYLDFEITPTEEKIQLDHQLLLLGSCFSENIGEYLIENKLNALINPFGTIYNPISLFHCIERSLIPEIEFKTIKQGDIYYEWGTHSKISDSDESMLYKTLNEKRKETLGFVRKANWIIISPGTAWVYILRKSGQLVANCHKVPQKEFDKRILTINEIRSSFDQIKSQVEVLNPKVKWLFTVSPVRHIRDGLVENNQSKAILLHSTHEIVHKYTNCYYFPSYEIVIDQLRDYRFFDEDMVHPNDQAIKYIWDRFKDTLFDNELKKFTEEWEKILRAVNHRPFHPGTSSHQKFLKETISKLERLANKVNTEKEIAHLQKQLI